MVEDGQGLCTGGRIGRTDDNKIIQVMEDVTDTTRPYASFQGVVNNFRGRTEAKWKHRVHV